MPKILGEDAKRLTIGDLRRAIMAVPTSKDAEGVDIILPFPVSEDGAAYLHKAVYSDSNQISSPGFVLVAGETFDY
jgi:hypothetical protein